MSDTFYAIILVLGPVYLACGLAVAWSYASWSDRLPQFLRRCAVFWAITLTLAWLAIALTEILCEDSWLFGYRDCTGIYDEVANTIAAISLLSYGAGIVFGVVLLIWGGIVEALARSRNDQL